MTIKKDLFKKGIITASALIACLYGCERPNPYKLSGDTSAVFEDCPTPKFPDENVSSQVSSTSTSGEMTTGKTVGPSVTATVGTGYQDEQQQEQTELDKREFDYSEALRTASILIVGDAPTLSEIYELGDLPLEQQKAKYEELVDKKLSDSRFADTLIEFFKYTFKMGGAATISGEPTRDTAPTFAARIVYEEKDWRNILTQVSNTCPTYNATTKIFTDGNCMNLPAGMNHSGILTDPGAQSLYYGNLSFRRNRFYHETFLCRSGNEQSGGEPTDNPPTDAPCSGGTSIPGYQNKWPVNEIAGVCNGGRVDFHAYNNSNVCANCHATWNHRAPLFSQFDSKGVFQSLTPAGEYSVFVPVEGSPRAKLSDWLCIGSSCPNGGNNTTAWKKSMKVNGVDTSANANTINELGQVMSQDDEVVECAVKRMWNYAMGRADITEIGGRSWVNLPDRNDPNPELVTMSKLVLQFKNNGYNLKKVFRSILVSEDFTRF
ncbi:MAG: hypothetical protein EBU90_17200 [Proteobacteria bacterium]|nr:hypothetical protein [Pseudomonadota bacterium]